MKTLVCLFSLVMLTIPSTRAGERLTIRVSPAYAFAPADLTVRTSVEPDPANRSIEVIADSPDFYRSSRVQLHGDQAPRTRTIEFRGLPPGQYGVIAILRGVNGEERAFAKREVNVITIDR